MTMVTPFTRVGSEQEATVSSWRSQVGSLHMWFWNWEAKPGLMTMQWNWGSQRVCLLAITRSSTLWLHVTLELGLCDCSLITVSPTLQGWHCQCPAHPAPRPEARSAGTVTLTLAWANTWTHRGRTSWQWFSDQDLLLKLSFVLNLQP